MPTTKAPRRAKALKKSVSSRKTAAATRVPLSIKMTKEDVRLYERGLYTAAVVRGGVPLGEPGEPALPWRKVFVAVPWDAQVRGVEIVREKTTTLADGVVVEPCQPNVPTLLGASVEWVPPDHKVYASRTVWPADPVRVSTVRRTGGFAMAEIEICPFRYQLRSKKLQLVERLDLTLEYTQTGEKLEKPRSLAAFLHEREYAHRVEKMVLNPEDVGRLRDIQGIQTLTDLTVLPKVEHVIITAQSLAATFERLAAWRTRQGLTSRVVTVEDILAGSVPNTGGATFFYTSGYSDGGTRDTAEAIRNFVKWASVNWLTQYVLLGGDTEVIPCRKAIHTKAGTVRYRDINTPTYGTAFGAIPQASTEEAGSPAAGVVDDDAATVWQCTSSDTDPWVRIRVGTNRPINSVKLTWGADHPSSYEIQISDDATSWTNVHSTTSGAGGEETITFDCVTATHVRLRITSGTDFALAKMAAYGPVSTKWSAAAYALNSTTTRVYLGTGVSMSQNPTNSLDENLILIKEGPHAGTIVPYDEASDGSTLGWHFVEQLTELPGVVSSPATTKYIEIRGPSQYHGERFALKRDYNYIPTDLYYADIAAGEYPSSGNHDWDADGNGIYGERYGGQLDGVNGIADLYLGRAPIETADEADVLIDKIIRYEKFVDADDFGFEFELPKDFAVSVLLGSQNWGHTNTVGQLDGSAAGKENIRKTYMNFDASRWKFTRRYQDHADVPAADQTDDLEEASKDEILNAVKAGNNVVSLSSHGSSGYLCYLVTDDIDDVSSDAALFYGNACSTSKFDLGLGEAFSEWTVLNPNGAAVAYVGNSRFGWTGDNPIELEFWEMLLECDRLGDMFNACKLVRLGWQSYSLNLLGDPAMRIWSDRPRQIDVSHAEEICDGDATVVVQVAADGVAVEDAVVCVTTSAGDPLGTGSTDAAGAVSLDVVAVANDVLRVTVTGKDLLPYFGSITVVECENGCTTAVVCTTTVACTPAISCGPAIYCGPAIELPPEQCGMAIELPPGQCGMAIDICPNITPKDFGIFDHIQEIWGTRDLGELAERLDTDEVRKTLERLPKEMGKAVEMMLRRIKEDRRGG